MPVDPSIPLSFQPTQNLGPNIGQTVLTAEHIMELREQQRQAQSQNALKQILSMPGALDATGNPTPQTLQKVGSVDPGVMMKLRQNMLMSQQRELQTAVLKSNLFQKQSETEQDIRGRGLTAYEQAKKSGLSDEQANKAGQAAVDEGIGEARKSGLFSEQQLANPKPFNYQGYQASSMSHEEWQRQQNKERDEGRADERQRRMDASANQSGWALVTQENKDGTKTQYWTNPRTSENKTLSGKPFTPDDAGQVSKVGTAPKPASQSEQDRKAIAKGVDSDPKFKDRPDDVRAAEKERRIKEAAAPPISDEAADLVADRVLSGDERASVGMARSSANITKVTNSILKRAAEKHMDGADIARMIAQFAGSMQAERTLGTRTANMEVAANEVKNMAPLALSASKVVDRTQYPTLNSILIAAERGTGDENVVRFGLAANSLIYTYAKFLNPTGIPTDADKARATDILSTAWTKGQFAAAIDQIQKEIQSGRAAVQETRTEVGETLTGKGKVVEPPTPAAPAKPGSLTEGGIQLPPGADVSAFPKLTNDEAGRAARAKLKPGDFYIAPDGSLRQVPLSKTP